MQEALLYHVIELDLDILAEVVESGDMGITVLGMAPMGIGAGAEAVLVATSPAFPRGSRSL